MKGVSSSFRKVCLAAVLSLMVFPILPVAGWSGERWESWEGDGFSFRHPEGWKVRTNGKGAVGLAGPGGESLIIWPVFSDRKISDAFASRLVGSMTRKLEPDCRLGNARVVMPGAARANGTWGGRDFVATVAWKTTPSGDAANYLLASAPRGALDGATPAFAGIMKSLSLRGNGKAPVNGGGSPARKVAYTTFTDPTESAFTVDVPVGWQVKGGVARFNASDVRPWLRLMSKDGRTLVFMGDPRISSMLVPNQPLARMGFTEGMVWDAGYNQRFLLKSYYPGKEFARLYAQEFLSNQCGDALVEDFRDRPELSATINRIFRENRSPFATQELHAGEISRNCPGAGRAQYVFGGTLLSQIPSYQGTFSMWVVNYLYGFDGPSEEAATALAITRRVADSFRVTSHWAQMNGGLQSNVSTIVAQTGAAIAKTVSAGYWNAQRTREKSLEKYGQAILGVEEMLDPLTREKIEVVSGSNHAWIDPKGNVVGTRTHTSPGIDYRELLQVKK